MKPWAKRPERFAWISHGYWAMTAQRPRAFRLEPEGEKGAASSVVLLETADPFVETPSAEPDAGAKRGFLSLGRIFASALGLFLSLAIGLWAYDVVASLLAASPVLGWIAAGLAVVAVLALLLMAVREWRAIRRLAVLSDLRKAAKQAHDADDREGASRVVRDLLAKVPAGRGAERAELKDHAAAIIDGRDLLIIAERLLLKEADRQAEETVSAASRRVSIVTAISPRAWVDILFVLAQSVRLIRRIAEIYGGRPGGLGAVRLFRKVLGHLALTGGVAMTDSVLSQIVGAGLAARLSAKLGEGVLNGVLTARVGIAAIEICRPLPYFNASPPRLSDIASKLLSRDTALSRSGEG
jgi:putative membrane protein